jgi:hypothetical protein
MFVPQAHIPDNYEIMSCLSRKAGPGEFYYYDKTAEGGQKNCIQCYSLSYFVALQLIKK